MHANQYLDRMEQNWVTLLEACACKQMFSIKKLIQILTTNIDLFTINTFISILLRWTNFVNSKYQIQEKQ